MPSYSTPEAVAGFLKDFQMRINHQKKGTFSPAHVRYFLTISRYGKEFFHLLRAEPSSAWGADRHAGLLCPRKRCPHHAKLRS